MKITEGELLRELEAALGAHLSQDGQDGPTAYTRDEIQRAMDWPRNRAHEIIGVLLDTGRWEHVKVYRQLRNKVVRRVDAYRPVPKP